LSGNPGIEDSLETLKKALATCSNPERIIHHLDRGIRYCSHPYTKLLTRKGIQTSMTEENYCYENGLAERVNEILKEEYMLESCFKDVLSCDALLTITVEGGSNSHGFVRIGGCRCTLISLHFFRC
jgi:transposase InsO family protein